VEEGRRERKNTFRLGVREEVGRYCSCLVLVAPTNLGRGSKRDCHDQSPQLSIHQRYKKSQ
jgi:hypothetical protein